MTQNMMMNFKQLMSDPAGYAMSHWGISKDMAGDPNVIISKMMGEGRITQAQYNQAHNMAKQMMRNPMFNQFFN